MVTSGGRVMVAGTVSPHSPPSSSSPATSPSACRKPVKTLTTKERKKSRFGNAFHLTR